MMKPATPKGTRDFGPQEVFKRNYIFSVIKKVFEKYAFLPLETPAMELLSTLSGKYGDEGDQLLFKILKNGDFLEKADAFDNYKKMAFQICEKGLRYDLTIPFARYVAMNRHALTFPFKRYQIQTVWRGDKPQKGRYQEFYQCDVDVVGSNAMLQEAELVCIYDEVFANLHLPVQIRLNNRKILAGIAEVANISDKFMAMTIALDKLDKVGVEGVKKELLGRDIPEAATEFIFKIIQTSSMEQIKKLLQSSPLALEGIAEYEEIMAFLATMPLKNEVVFDISLARGLNYYTGTIFEVLTPAVQIGSLGGGGRYADLTGLFGLPDMSGVGVSFGAERIYDVLEELQLFPETAFSQVEVIFISFDAATLRMAFAYAQQLRAAGICTDIYPDPETKLKKQMKFANDKNAKYVLIIGEEELKNNTISVKNMRDGVQEVMSFTEFYNTLTQS
ncbi:MAG: histidine--tRNA ligase [Chitinophagales bacterium]|nr:histidine--tRNA ligase [Bacteroidota bacterium]MCB9042320.1 histidine--tRNA ligase [Chitinophagales bacterium]